MATTKIRPFTPQDIARALIGAWRLVSWSETKKDGTTEYPLGRHAIG
jgi:Lipocalin-like domain